MAWTFGGGAATCRDVRISLCTERAIHATDNQGIVVRSNYAGADHRAIRTEIRALACPNSANLTRYPVKGSNAVMNTSDRNLGELILESLEIYS